MYKYIIRIEQNLILKVIFFAVLFRVLFIGMILGRGRREPCKKSVDFERNCFVRVCVKQNI